MKLSEATKEELLELIDFWGKETLSSGLIQNRLECELYFIRTGKILKTIEEKIAQSKRLTPGASKWYALQKEILSLNEKIDKMSKEWTKQHIQNAGKQ